MDDKYRNTYRIPSARASAIRGFKIGVTKYAREHNLAFEWQARFHDHIVRDPKEMFHIVSYIRDNVLNWKDDCFYK